MHLQINFKSGLPVYLQVVEQIKASAASGSLRPGEALPAIRILAEQLRINRNTVAKAYTELESQGIVETLAGKGCYLTENHSPYKKQMRMELLSEAVDTAIVRAYHLQVTRADFLGLIQKRLDSFQQKLQATKESKADEL